MRKRCNMEIAAHIHLLHMYMDQIVKIHNYIVKWKK